MSQNEYLVNHIEQCSPELFADVAVSEDFQRGLLWLSALHGNEEDHVVAAILQVTASGPERPAADCELLMLLDDSRRIHWLHPGRDPKGLEIKVRNIADGFGWHVSA